MTDTKTVLWAGPQDGAEVVITPDQVVVYVDGPPVAVEDITYDTLISGKQPRLRGVYARNTNLQRFDWKGYERESGV